ncbi:MAG: hypothetical protein U1E56_11575 [Bauldia sp.]
MLRATRLEAAIGGGNVYMPGPAYWLRGLLTAGALTISGATEATAFELCGGAGEPITRAAGRGYDFGVGFDLTSDLVERGISQGNRKPTFEAQAQAAFGLGYAGVSFARLDEDAEFSVSLGLRPQWGPLALDLGVKRSVRANDPAENETEFYAAGLFSLTDRLGLGAELNLGTGGERCMQAALQFDLGRGFEASAELGRVTFSDAAMIDYSMWGAGLSYELSDWASIDLRYTATDLSKAACLSNTDASHLCGARVMLGLSLSTSLARLSTRRARDDD